MKKLVLASIVVLSAFAGAAVAQTRERDAQRLADRMATEFSMGRLSRFDKTLLQGRSLELSIQHSITDGDDPEFETKRFRSFTAMERWLKADEREPGFPIRTSGQRVSCRRGLCRLDLRDNQMAHNHVYLTRMWYRSVKGKILVWKLRILYG